MNNPLFCVSFFATPASMEELYEHADSMQNTGEAYRMIAFTLNYCNSLVEKEMNKVECVLGHANCTICV
jgi:hypothetical protein